MATTRSSLGLAEGDTWERMSDTVREIDLDEVFAGAGHGFGPPGFEMEPPPVAHLGPSCRYELRSPLSHGLLATHADTEN